MNKWIKLKRLELVVRRRLWDTFGEEKEKNRKKRRTTSCTQTNEPDHHVHPANGPNCIRRTAQRNCNQLEIIRNVRSVVMKSAAFVNLCDTERHLLPQSITEELWNFETFRSNSTATPVCQFYSIRLKCTILRSNIFACAYPGNRALVSVTWTVTKAAIELTRRSTDFNWFVLLLLRLMSIFRTTVIALKDWSETVTIACVFPVALRRRAWLIAKKAREIITNQLITLSTKSGLRRYQFNQLNLKLWRLTLRLSNFVTFQLKSASMSFNFNPAEKQLPPTQLSIRYPSDLLRERRNSAI